MKVMGVKDMNKKKIAISLVIVLIAAASLFGASMLLKADKPKYDVTEINKGGDWKQVTNEIFISAGAYARVNMALVVSKGEAALIDTGNNEEEALRVKKYIEDNNLKLSKVFITHPHSDHTANLSMFKVGQENIYDFNNTTDNQIIKMGDRSFKILRTPGHCNDTHISIELVEDNILVAGDVVPTNVPPLINYGGDSNTLQKTLERIKKNHYSLIIPGHGDLLDAKRTVDVQLEYLKNARAQLKALIESGKTVQDAKKIKLQDLVKEPNGFTSAAQTEHLNDINKIYYEIKAEIRNAK